MKKLVCLLLAFTFLAFIIAGCGSSLSDNKETTGASGTDAASVAPAPTEAQKEAITLNLYHDNNPQKGTNDDVVNEALAQKINADTGLNVKFSFTSVQHDQAIQKINMLMASGDLDAFSIALDFADTEFMTKDTVTPLDDLYGKYTNVQKQTNPDSLGQGTYKGKLLLLPTKPGQNVNVVTWIRKDLLDKVDLSVPKTFQEFHDAILKMKATDPKLLGYTAGLPGWMFTQGLGTGYNPKPLDAAGNLIPTIQTQLGGCIQPTDPYWRRWITRMGQWYKEGVINNEIFTLKMDQIPDLLNTGRLTAIAAPVFDMQTNADKLINAENRQEWVLSPLVDEDGNHNATWAYGKMSSNFIGIPKNAQHGEEFFKVLDWMCANVDNASFARFGREGQEYDMVDGKVFSRKNDSGVPIYTSPLFSMNGGVFREELGQLSASFKGTEWKKVFEPDFPYFDVFDGDILYKYEKSKDVLPQVESISHEFFVKAVTGSITVNDETVQKLIDDMNKAGMQTFMEEMNEQYHDAVAARK